jgi:hypothetical protein
MINKSAPSFPVSIFVAGDYDKARAICQDHCDAVGLCVTVTRTTYVYTGGEEEGVIVGLINYPRFPQTVLRLIEKEADELSRKLVEGLHQHSCTIQTPERTTWFSWREA